MIGFRSYHEWRPMFDRYNEPARRSLFYARYEAGVLGSATIETEHLLVGLLEQGDVLVEQLIGWPRLAATDVRQRIQDRVGVHARVPDSIELPFSEDTKLNFLGRPVIDATGITDSCDIELTGEYDTPEALVKALRDQLGLELTNSL